MSKKECAHLSELTRQMKKTYVYFFTHSRLIKMMRVLSPYIQWNEVGSCINYLLLNIFSYSLTNVKLQFVKMVVVLNDLYVKKNFIYCLYSYLNGQIETFLHYTLNVYFWLWLSIRAICRLYLWLSVWLFWSIKIISYPIIVSNDNQKLNNQIYSITFLFVYE